MSAAPQFLDLPIIDAHQHLYSSAGIARLWGKSQEFGYRSANIVTIAVDHKACAGNALALLMKALYPGQVYAFGGIQYRLPLPSPPPAERTDVLAQVQELMRIGCDGIKLIEGKPTVRKELHVPLDHPIYMDFYAFMEEKGYPITSHVCDPLEYWDPVLCPEYAKKMGWFYDESFAGFEQLRAEMLAVLKRFPRLKVMLAHFFFLATDLPRAYRIMEEYPNAILDLTPGAEQYPYLAKNPGGWREFFLKYQDRIVFGTDVSDREGKDDQALARMVMVRRFLEDDGPFDHYQHKMHGLGLPRAALEKIYSGNFKRIVGAKPRKLDHDLAAAHCEKVAAQAAQIPDVALREKAVGELKLVAAKLRELGTAARRD